MEKTVYSSQFKAGRVLEVLRGEETLDAIASHHNLNLNMLRNWKKKFLNKAPQLFEESSRIRELAAKERLKEQEELLKTIGQLTIERDWLKKNQLKYLDPNTKRSLVKSHSKLS